MSYPDKTFRQESTVYLIDSGPYRPLNG